jgi:putative ABC transport system permease protein
MAIAPLLRAAMSPRRLRSLVLVGVVICLAAAGIAAAVTVRGTASGGVDAEFDRNHGPDLVVYVAADRASDTARLLSADPHVRGAGRPVASADATIIGGEQAIPVELRAAQAPGSLNAPVIVDGRGVRNAGEVLVDAGLADADGIELGDTITVQGELGSATLTVVGTGYDFTDCLYPNCDPPHLWTAGATMAGLVDLGVASRLVPVDVDDDPRAITAVVGDVRAALGDSLLGWNDWADTRGDMLVETDFFGAFLGGFGAFVMLSCAVVVASAIGARTVARRRMIGLYKAVGYTSRQLGAAIVLEHLAIALIACAAGNLLASVLAPTFRVGSLRVIETPTWAWNGRAFLTSTVAVCTIVVMATVLPAVRAGRIEVAEALAGTTGRRRRSTVRSRSEPALTRLPLTAWLGLTSLRVRPLRTVLNVMAVMIAVVAAVVSMAIDRSVDRVLDDPALAGDPADAFVSSVTAADAGTVEDVLDELSAVAGWYTVADAKAVAAGADVHVRAIGGELGGSAFVIGGGRSRQHPGEAIAGFGLMRELGWKVGDRVDVRLVGRSLAFTVVGWYRDTEDSGRILQIGMDDYRLLGADGEPGYAATAVDGVGADRLAAELTATLDGHGTVVANQSDRSGVAPFRIALGVMTLLLGLVATAHILTSVLTTSRERARTFAVQRAVGFDDRALRAQALCHGGTVAGLAVAAGIPVGWWAQAALGDWLTREIGVGPGISIGPNALQLATIATVTVIAVAAATVVATQITLRRPAPSLIARD